MFKVLALVIGSLPGAAAGVLFALHSGLIDPNNTRGGSFGISRQERRGKGFK